MSVISIITPSYNSAEYISNTVQSVICQTFIDWEMIVVDDCSTDDSVALLLSFSGLDPRIKLVRLLANSGAAVARNKGIELASGKYIAFLDSDDLWLPDKLEKQMAFMRSNNAPFSFSAYEKIDELGSHLGRVGVPSKVTYRDMLKSSSIGCLTAMYDTDYFGKVYMPNIRKRQDLGLWLELLKRVPYASGLNESLALYRVRSGSISANKLSAASYQWRIYREVENLNLLESMYFFAHYAVRGWLRTKLPALARKLGVLD